MHATYPLGSALLNDKRMTDLWLARQMKPSEMWTRRPDVMQLLGYRTNQKYAVGRRAVSYIGRQVHQRYLFNLSIPQS
jgi:hypothetical protein